MQDQPIPTGFCQCGCGQKTAIAIVDWPLRGHVKGQPKRFLRGHNNRRMQNYRVEDRGYETACWVWQGAPDVLGYTRMRVAGRGHMIHRWFYEQANGPIPPEMDLDHLCRVRNCVNPDHLEPVTHAENTRRGKSAKLDATTVLEIRRRAAAGEMQAALAREFAVTETTISYIVKRLSWKDV